MNWSRTTRARNNRMVGHHEIIVGRSKNRTCSGNGPKINHNVKSTTHSDYRGKISPLSLSLFRSRKYFLWIHEIDWWVLIFVIECECAANDTIRQYHLLCRLSKLWCLFISSSSIPFRLIGSKSIAFHYRRVKFPGKSIYFIPYTGIWMARWYTILNRLNAMTHQMHLWC